MKRGILILFLGLISIMSYAQQDDDTYFPARSKAYKYYTSKIKESMDSIKRLDSKVFFSHVGSLDIKDKIFVTNKTSYYIEKAVIGYINSKMAFETIGAASNITPGKKIELISFEKNRLKMLKGKMLVLKVKGNNTKVTQEDDGISSSDSDKNITYDFQAELSEVRHDLCIDIVNKQGNDILDF